MLMILISVTSVCAESETPGSEKIFFGKLLGKTTLDLGAKINVLSGGTLKGSYCWGFRGLLKGPVNRLMDLKISFTDLQLEDDNFEGRWYLGKLGPMLHFLPSKIIDPYVEGGVLFVYQDKKEKRTGAESESSSGGWYAGGGLEILIGKYSSLRLYSSYIKEYINDDDAFSAGLLLNSCYKNFCGYIRSEYLSPSKLFEDAESLSFEAGIIIKFSIVNLLKSFEEASEYEEEEDY
jgi:hypothetical protein